MVHAQSELLYRHLKRTFVPSSCRATGFLPQTAGPEWERGRHARCYAKTKAPCRVLPAGRLELIRLNEAASLNLRVRYHASGFRRCQCSRDVAGHHPDLRLKGPSCFFRLSAASNDSLNSLAIAAVMALPPRGMLRKKNFPGSMNKMFVVRAPISNSSEHSPTSG